MEGIETSRIDLQDNRNPLGVSRCPDMEGIETVWRRYISMSMERVSVGAPTWRGLKPFALPNDYEFSMSVGAPTWRGLKHHRSGLA